MIWWVLQIIGCIGVTIALTITRIHGLSWTSVLWFILIQSLIGSWVFAKSYEISPSFFQAWFIGIASLAGTLSLEWLHLNSRRLGI